MKSSLLPVKPGISSAVPRDSPAGSATRPARGPNRPELSSLDATRQGDEWRRAHGMQNRRASFDKLTGHRLDAHHRDRQPKGWRSQNDNGCLAWRRVSRAAKSCSSILTHRRV